MIDILRRDHERAVKKIPENKLEGGEQWEDED
jgi:hypothetical protein